MSVTITEGLNQLNVQMVMLTGTLQGTVTDSTTGLPISGVTVILNGKSTSTNANGNYSIMGIVPGLYGIRFEKSGYQTIQL